jgi:peptidyl-prolyl cis-trans isomerase D
MAVYKKLDNVHFFSYSLGFCLLAIIGDIFNSGGFNSTSKDVEALMERYFFEDFRVKVSNVEKKGSGYYFN